MTLELVSFVGVDEHTKLDDLLDFKSSKDILYEFSVLYSDSKNGTYKRYPTHEFSNKFLEWSIENYLTSSLHLCGNSVTRFLNKDKEILELCKKAFRIQLNLNMKNYADINKLADDIVDVSLGNYISIILQKNKSKTELNKLVLEKAGDEASFFLISLLNDSSGGFGRTIEQVDPPHKICYTGYAGGINPDNVLGIIDKIEAVNTEKMYYYIDMESGIRTENVFDIEKCRTIKNLIENRG